MGNCRTLKRFLKRVNLLLMCPLAVVVWVIVKQTAPIRPRPVQVAHYDSKSVFIHRKKHLVESCASNPTISLNTVSFTRDSNKKLLFCAAPYIAVPFQSDLLNAESRNQQGYISLNATPTDTQDRTHARTLNQDTAAEIRSKHDGYSAVVLTSDPYWRLYNLYINDIVLPGDSNSMWHSRFNETFRYWAKDDYSTCARGVSFAGFVRYIIKTKAQDVELRPLSEFCGVCDIQYDVIGKVETIDEEVLRFSEYFNLKSDEITSKYNRQRVFNDIVSLVNESFAWFHKKADKSCTEIAEIAQRLWKALQMKGIIKKSSIFPSEFLKNDFKPNELIHVITRNIVDSFSLYYSTYQHFLTTFSSVPLNDKKSLKELYNLDFLMFDYEFYPRQLFEYTGKPRIGDVPSTFLNKIDMSMFAVSHTKK